MTTTTGSANSADPAENYRMYDGIDDAGIDADDKVMTLEVGGVYSPPRTRVAVFAVCRSCRRKPLSERA